MKWMSSRELLCLTMKLQSSKRITTLQLDFLVINFCCCSKLKRKGVKIISQTENVVKEVTAHITSVLLVHESRQLLFARLFRLLLSAQRSLITVNYIHQ